ncbi:MAG: hypothetical protein R2709_00500 [Marmoricola sp.]
MRHGLTAKLQLPGTGLICMGSFAFADAPGASTGRSAGSWWAGGVITPG